jgi:hypothetical protein
MQAPNNPAGGIRLTRPRLAKTNSAGVYVRHRPETTLLYQIVQEYWPELQAELASHGRYLPTYVTKEFDGRASDPQSGFYNDYSQAWCSDIDPALWQRVEPEYTLSYVVSGACLLRLKAPALGEDPVVIRTILVHLDKKGAFAGDSLLPGCRASPSPSVGLLL